MRPTGIITPETRELVSAAEEHAHDDALSEQAIGSLVRHLSSRCAIPEVRQRYDEYTTYEASIAPYPVDEAGYAVSFDPLENEVDLFDAWKKHGVVVAKQVVPAKLCAAAIGKVHATLNQLSSGKFAIDNPESYDAMPTDASGTPILTRGFFEVYHDDSLAQLRQSLRMYLHHVIVWGRADLWTTFDRFGVKLPGHGESKALPLHVDQNPNVHPDFRTTQGVLALQDCPTERGTLVTVPGSKGLFPVYAEMALNKGEYVELNTQDTAADILVANARPMPLRQGDLVTWDSRTTHANTANVSGQTRYIALVSAGPARPENDDAALAREQAYLTGEGSNVRDALMHASRRPRYSDHAALQSIRKPEQLSLLGRLLYGQLGYDQV